MKTDTIDKDASSTKDKPPTNTDADDDADKLAAALQETLQIQDQKEATTKEDDSAAATTPEQMQAWRKEAPAELVKVADWIADGKIKRILALTGAGLSVAAGIPDFRTPGTGLYDNLQKYNLPFPEAVFDLHFYRKNPQPFTQLAKELWPGLYFVPTLAHSFLTLLHQKGLLVRCYTQNIDGLEHVAKLPSDALVECHGHFRTASCIDCGQVADADAVKDTIIHHGEAPTCGRCHGYVKPDIVFFGEGLPKRFHMLLRQDAPKADACLILGTSLAVMPVGGIPDMVGRHAKRILLNRELVGSINPRRAPARDVFHGADCDESVEWLAKLLGWWPELQAMHAELQKEFEAATQSSAAKQKSKKASLSSSSSAKKKDYGKSSNCVVG